MCVQDIFIRIDTLGYCFDQWHRQELISTGDGENKNKHIKQLHDRYN